MKPKVARSLRNQNFLIENRPVPAWHDASFVQIRSISDLGQATKKTPNISLKKRSETSNENLKDSHLFCC
jgi:hypothetical protein